jgi:hypothetical protein
MLHQKFRLREPVCQTTSGELVIVPPLQDLRRGGRDGVGEARFEDAQILDTRSLSGLIFFQCYRRQAGAGGRKLVCVFVEVETGKGWDAP